MTFFRPTPSRPRALLLALAALGVVSSAPGCRSDPVPREPAISDPVQIRAELLWPGGSRFEGPVVIEVSQGIGEDMLEWGPFAGSAGPVGLDASFELPGWDPGAPTLVRIGPVADWGETIDLERVTLEPSDLRLWVHEFSSASTAPLELRVPELRTSTPPLFGSILVAGAGPAWRLLVSTEAFSGSGGEDERSPHSAEVPLKPGVSHGVRTWSVTDHLTVRELDGLQAPRDHLLSRGRTLVLRAPLDLDDVELFFPEGRFPEPRMACLFPLAAHVPLDAAAEGDGLSWTLMQRVHSTRTLYRAPWWSHQGDLTVLHLDDMPEGDYVLELWPRSELARKGPSVEFRFTVPDSPGPHRFEVR